MAFVAIGYQFQSTLPARGATTAQRANHCRLSISIHAPRTGSDGFLPSGPAAASVFQSTLPARGATLRFGRRPRRSCISIHAPRTGSDVSRDRRVPVLIYFNPRSPHGERRPFPASGIPGVGFQSTLPARGATPFRQRRTATRGISIHAPRTGSDTAQHPDSPRGGHFNPRSPHGERPSRGPAFRPSYRNFNPRSPHGERRSF